MLSPPAGTRRCAHGVHAGNGGAGYPLVSLGRSPRDHYPEARQPETPLSILKSRYAKGEISKEEYAGMKSELQ
ncbi:MAG: SHOCT domain-containing protein [Chloroflexi bacterium]|nr:SHOCT domain-containing protein [Chloroflexota bacterium]